MKLISFCLILVAAGILHQFKFNDIALAFIVCAVAVSLHAFINGP